MKYRYYLPLLSVIILCMFTNANAGHRAKSFTISPMIGGALFDSDLNLEDDMVFGGAAGYNFTEHLGLEGAYLYADAETDDTSVDTNVSFCRLDALYHFMPEKRLVPYVAAGLGGVFFNPDNPELAANFGGGLKYFVAEDIALRADVREVMMFPEDCLLYTAGVVVYLGGSDKPAKSRDKIEKTVRPDSDGDGVSDDVDKCPKTTAGKMVNSVGCPVDNDGDGDGVADNMDKCPNTPAGIIVNNDGCPMDSDGDGISDDMDKCPNSPAGTVVNTEGCPVDSDGDGVLGADDECPGTPQGADVDNRGCWVLKNLKFDVGQNQIKPDYFDILNNAVRVLKMNPDIHVEIQGHTDSKGSQTLNRQLSLKRAQAVQDFLTEHGIDAARITSKGLGETDPIATNDTPEGRAKKPSG